MHTDLNKLHERGERFLYLPQLEEQTVLHTATAVTYVTWCFWFRSDISTTHVRSYSWSTEFL